MSRFFSSKYKSLEPYTPGEQPQNMKYIKLNTNESPFPPSERAVSAMYKAARTLNLYPDPQCRELTCAVAANLGVEPDEVLMTNGSDEILNFAFMAFGERGAAFPDITYGFYTVFSVINSVEYEEIPLKSDFTVNTLDYAGLNKAIFIANPNAPTGIALPTEDIEKILQSNPDGVVVVDEAYVDFGNESCVKLTGKYDNLLVTRTFSKSRSMAGARLGFGVGCKELIADLNKIKYSTNPYNINKMTMAAGIGTMADEEYTLKNCAEIIKNREYTANELKKLGFLLTPSAANFVFAKHSSVGGEKIYSVLKNNGVLVRHFDKKEISEYNRITIGTREQMDKMLDILRKELSL